MRPKSDIMGRMEEKELVEILTTLYDNRLKALIGYRSTDFTREIIGFWFRRMYEISRQTVHYGFKAIGNIHLSNILSFMKDGHTGSVAEAGTSVTRLVFMLEPYQKANLEKLLPDWQSVYPDTHHRKVFGIRFKEEVRKNPELYPESLSHDSFLSQLNYTTKARNDEAHPIIGFSSTYSRYLVLYCYDTILSYLLYTFYYMALKEDYQFEHIKP